MRGIITIVALTVWLIACSGPGASRRADSATATLMMREELARSSDSDVEQAILDRIAAVIDADPAREGEIVRGLPLGAQMLYPTCWVEAEVDNGGFQQYFWNSTGQFANEAVAGFDLLGAKDHAELMRRAIAIADAERDT